MRAAIIGVAVAMCPGLAHSADVGLRTSVAPTVGSAVSVHRRVALAGSAQGRFFAAGPTFGDRYGVAVRAGPRIRAHEIVGVGVSYGYAHGHFPLDGPGDREHGARVGVTLMSRGKRFVVGDAPRVDLRGIRVPGEGWRFAPRLRNELRLTGVFRPWLKLSGTSEPILHPTERGVGLLQLRFGVALHGEIALKKNRRPDARNPGLFWIVANQIGLSPVALARGNKVAGNDADRDERQRADNASTLDMVVTIGLSGLF